MTIFRVLRRNPGAMFGMVGIVVVIAIALLSPVLSPYDPISQDPNARLQAPSLGHLLGTDEFGRDILSRIFYGAVTSLEVGVGVVTIDVLLGLFLGAIAAYYGRLVDTLIMRIADIMLAFPGLVLAILLMAVLGPGIPNVILSVSLVNWPGYARVIRSQSLAMKQMPFVRAAQAQGAGRAYILFRHVIPNSIASATVLATLGIGFAILAEAGLSFLGLGITPPTPSWGSMITDGMLYALAAPHLVVIPGIVLSLTVVAFNLFGDGLRDALDPSLRI